MEYNMQKMLFALTAIGLAAALSTAGSQKVEAASIVPASIEQASPGSGVVLADEHRSHWRSWQRRHRNHGYRHEGYRRG